MSDIIVMPADVLTHLKSTDAAVATLDNAFAHCDGLTGDQRVAWANFKAEYSSFSNAKRKAWSNTVFNVLAVLGPTTLTELQLRDDDAKILDYEHQIAGWQTIAKNTCGLSTPGLTPRDDPNSPKDQTLKTVEHIAIAGACIVGGIGLLVAAAYVRKFLP